MNEKQKALLEAAAYASGIKGIMRDDGLEIYEDIKSPYHWKLWNPIIDLHDRYGLARRCKLCVDWEFGMVYLPAYLLQDDEYKFTHGDDLSEAIAILKAAAATGEK